MDAHEHLSNQIDHIEQDDRLSDEEKRDAIAEEEQGFMEHKEQYEAEQKALGDRYGF